jgi:hypothetical protein
MDGGPETVIMHALLGKNAPAARTQIPTYLSDVRIATSCVHYLMEWRKRTLVWQRFKTSACELLDCSSEDGMNYLESVLIKMTKLFILHRMFG